jgi:hypothetical protein
MFKLIFRLTVTLTLLMSALSASADAVYRLTGAARIYSADPSASPNLELPVNPAFSSVLSLRGDSFHLNYDNASSNECAVKIKNQSHFSFDSAPFGNVQKLNKFLEDKFHTNSSDWTTTYLLQDAVSPSCTALRFSKIYASNSELILLDEPYIYIFQLENHRFKDSTKGFDCGFAKTDVEHLVCENPVLQKKDAAVNYGFVLMQIKYSKEISYQDPIRVDQIYWVSNVRNKCSTVDCLMRAYSSRIAYFKKRVSDSYPSYPEEENN